MNVTVARKPLAESTLAANTLAHGAGALNIDASRISSNGDHKRPFQPTRNDRQTYGQQAGFQPTNAEGRWPPNLILIHRPGCRREGGETVAHWICGPGCPASGDTSRFFKQIRRETMTRDLPQELLDYLYTMITPTHIGGVSVICLEPESYDWSRHEDASLHGAIIRGWSTPDPPPWLEEIWRALKPGAHLMLIAPEDQPTGHTGACHAEDQGFEIRDALFLAQEPGEVFYTAKASQTERNAGTAHLARGVTGEYLWYPGSEDPTELADLQQHFPDRDITAGVERRGIPEGMEKYFVEGRKRGNHHPTVKPSAIMKWLLEEFPGEGPVLDPFLGSGSTGIAALSTDRDFVGIEKQESYLLLSDARIRHWNRQLRPWDQAEIDSEADSRPPRKKLSFDDLLG